MIYIVHIFVLKQILKLTEKIESSFKFEPGKTRKLYFPAPGKETDSEVQCAPATCIPTPKPLPSFVILTEPWVGI